MKAVERETGKTLSRHVSSTLHAERIAAGGRVSVVLRLQADCDADFTADWNHSLQHRNHASGIRLIVQPQAAAVHVFP